MPLPVIADTFRVTLNHTGISGPGANVFHIRNTSDDETQVALDVDNAFGDTADPSHLLWPMSSGISVTSIDVLPLDGTSTTFHRILTNPLTGGASGNVLYNVAGIVTFSTAMRGPRGRGRMYIGPAADDSFDGGQVLHVAGAAVCQAAWADFTESLVVNSNSALCVASYVHADQHTVLSHTVRSYPGSMRRRAKFLQS